MAFSYTSYRINELALFHSSMRQMNVNIGDFTFVYNRVKSTVIFDTRKQPYVLVFMKSGVGSRLLLSVIRGYRVEIASSEEYYTLLNYFEIQPDMRSPGMFCLGDFMKIFIKNIPSNYILDDASRIAKIQYDRIDTQSEGIYPIGIKNWALFHARHPEIDKNLFHQSDKNKQKTKELYPSLFSVIKDMDVSITYSNKRGDETAAILDLKHKSLRR